MVGGAQAAAAALPAMVPEADLARGYIYPPVSSIRCSPLHGEQYMAV